MTSGERIALAWATVEMFRVWDTANVSVVEDEAHRVMDEELGSERVIRIYAAAEADARGSDLLRDRAGQYEPLNVL